MEHIYVCMSWRIITVTSVKRLVGVMTKYSTVYTGGVFSIELGSTFCPLCTIRLIPTLPSSKKSSTVLLWPTPIILECVLLLY